MALEAVELALAKQASKTKDGKATKSTVLNTLAGMGWCSFGSTGVEKSFLATLQAKGIGIPFTFASLMGIEPDKTSMLLTQPPLPPAPVKVEKPVAMPPPIPQGNIKPAVTELPPEAPGDFTVVNLKAVSLMQTRDGKTSVRFIGSENGLNGSIGVSSLRASCNLIEFAI